MPDITLTTSITKSLEEQINGLFDSLYDGIGKDAQKSVIVINDYIARQRTMGVSDEIIVQNLNDDLDTDRLGLFKEFKIAIRSRLIGSIHQAGTLGMFDQFKEDWGSDKLFRWVAVGDERSCKDCQERDGKEEPLDVWQAIGLPASGFSVCNVRCRCVIEPVDIPKHESIKV